MLCVPKGDETERRTGRRNNVCGQLLYWITSSTSTAHEIRHDIKMSGTDQMCSRGDLSRSDTQTITDRHRDAARLPWMSINVNRSFIEVTSKVNKH